MKKVYDLTGYTVYWYGKNKDLITKNVDDKSNSENNRVNNYNQNNHRLLK